MKVVRVFLVLVVSVLYYIDAAPNQKPSVNGEILAPSVDDENVDLSVINNGGLRHSINKRTAGFYKRSAVHEIHRRRVPLKYEDD
ncbi:hypothetical protein RN001_014805 [Aquatica leii]|uniref:Uncharacterized protein n=1 Tax=Aquatica leii TaxID=1421715 RepID=A0AAN7S6D1_9COLE|nr:hypothetical protein RN001_014805 [Aquatica leii]